MKALIAATVRLDRSAVLWAALSVRASAESSEASMACSELTTAAVIATATTGTNVIADLSVPPFFEGASLQGCASFHAPHVRIRAVAFGTIPAGNRRVRGLPALYFPPSWRTLSSADLLRGRDPAGQGGFLI